MLERIFAELGPWNWMVLGFVLLTLEILVPGVFLLWIGLAALIVGTLSLLFWSADFWIWQVQILAFLALSLVCAFAGKKIMGKSGDASDQPLLNRRGDQLVGRTATLTEPISEDASSGIMTILLLLAEATLASASVYFCATN